MWLRLMPFRANLHHPDESSAIFDLSLFRAVCRIGRDRDHMDDVSLVILMPWPEVTGVGSIVLYDNGMMKYLWRGRCPPPPSISSSTLVFKLRITILNISSVKQALVRGSESVWPHPSPKRSLRPQTNSTRSWHRHLLPSIKMAEYRRAKVSLPRHPPLNLQSPQSRSGQDTSNR